MSKKPPRSSPPGTPPPGKLPSKKDDRGTSPEIDPLIHTHKKKSEPVRKKFTRACKSKPTKISKPTKKSKIEKIERTDERLAVSILTLLRPVHLNQCLESTLSTKTPMKIIVTNQADYSKANMAIINTWKDRSNIHYRVNDPRKWPGASRAEVFKMAKESGFEYIITLDDDCSLLPEAIDKLVKAADDHPEFYAISGYLITPHRGTYMLGGPITVLNNRHSYINFDFKPGVQEADFICNGFRLIRLEPLVLPDSSYTIGLTDFDWAMEAKSKGLRLAVCGEAGAYHKFTFINGKPIRGSVSGQYHAIRRNRSEIRKMREKFKRKWGYKV